MIINLTRPLKENFMNATIKLSSFLLFLLVLTVITSCSSFEKEEEMNSEALEELTENYEETAEELEEILLNYEKKMPKNKTAVEKAQIEIVSYSNDLLDEGLLLNREIKVQYPACAKLVSELESHFLRAPVALNGKFKGVMRDFAKHSDAAKDIRTYKPGRVEKGFHKGDELPPMSEIPEDVRHICYAAKDALVHPATVVVLVRKQGLSEDSIEDMIAEIQEVLHHIDEVE
jgi:hypothetical protein